MPIASMPIALPVALYQSVADVASCEIPYALDECFPHLRSRGGGVRLNYKVLSLATGGILAPVARTFAGLFPQVVSAMGLVL
ncbi:MAG: hypothetical protein F6J90_24440 [Moorea sp. SIOASIH]|uniref:hypothetical protein n=1 Tax=Moorena sp. SIOASIH TaxID=2607817 RepID=UPI0013BB45F2|nr:hypothetical protein [Moorena sp. SIOASIH]NEO39314.1 hypothetical protein [Moorena sp. SIOASIH]